ncbi:MAG: hypothetical protein ACE5IC_08945 [Candidatus Brocadiales bacterium]
MKEAFLYHKSNGKLRYNICQRRRLSCGHTIAGRFKKGVHSVAHGHVKD